MLESRNNQPINSFSSLACMLSARKSCMIFEKRDRSFDSYKLSITDFSRKEWSAAAQTILTDLGAENVRSQPG
ncbi:hypothetical protein ACTFBW_09165 [Aeromonas rivipollensis]